MKAITICQPYAQLIVRGEKRVENRGWPTNYRGPLVIHAGKSRAWLAPGDMPQLVDEDDPLVFGAAIGVATLVDCLHIARILAGYCDLHHPWLREHAHTEGPWCWVLGEVHRFPPIPCRGAQRLWKFPHKPESKSGNHC